MKSRDRRTAFLGLMLSGWLFADSATALKGKEHSELTNLAFKVALLHMQETHPEHKAIWDKLEADLLGKKAFKEKRSLGDITTVVDSLFLPEKLFLSPEDCADKGYRVKEVCDACGEQDPLTLECDNAILDQGKARMEKKQGQVIFRSLMAARINSRHFDVGAQESYNKFHARALQQVRNRIDRGTLQAENWSLALRTEAVALHFLEDFFAPGHIMTRRQVHEDLASRALHNRYNAKGMEALANPSRLEELGSLLDRALKENGGKRELDLAGGSRTLIEEGFRFAGAVDSPSEKLLFYGDGDMRKDKARVQRTVLLLLAAYSIKEVLKEGIPGGEPTDRLTLCYRPWSAEPERRGSPKSDSTCRAWGAAALLPATQDKTELEQCWRKVVDPVSNAPVDTAQSPSKLPENLLVGYPHFLCPTTGCKGIDDSTTDARGVEGEDYVHWVPGLSVAGYGVASRGGESTTGTGMDLDLILMSVSVEQIQKRDGCKFLDERFTFSKGARTLMGSLISLGYSQTRASDLDVSSWSYATQIPHVRGKYDMNYYYRVHLAYSEYSGPDLKSTAKPSAGLRFGLGVSFLFLEGGAELGYSMDKPGHLKKTAVFTLGLRAQYSLRP